MSHKCNSISIDQGAVLKMIKDCYVLAMEKAEDKQIQIMKNEIQRTTNGEAPGKPEWRNQISSMQSETYRTIVDNYLEFGVGIDDSLEKSCQYQFVRAMIILEGGGLAVGGNPITAGPTGRIVWNSDLDGKHKSNSDSSYLLPMGFNQKGNHFVDNAIKRMKKHFYDILSSTSSSLPSSIFYENVNVNVVS